MKHAAVVTAFAAALAAAQSSQLGFAQEPYPGYPYLPALCCRGGGRLLLFPLTGKQEVEVSLPVRSRFYRVSPDGNSLYTTPEVGSVFQRLPEKPPPLDFFKIQFHPLRFNPVPGSGSFAAFSSMAISEQDAVVVGKQRKGNSFVCGIFELKLSDGGVRPVLETKDCDDALTRTDISLSPDVKHAVAIHKRSLEIIDMANGTSRKIADGFQAAAWSPDGRWIAAALYSSLDARTTLFDAKTLAEKSMLATSTVFRVSWSPDSRFLLGWELLSGCGPDRYSYEVFDVETGRSFTIESSRCKVYGNDVGWVNKTIATQ